MVFEEAIEVRGKLINPLEGLRREDIPSQLEITLEDLEVTRGESEDCTSAGYVTLNKVPSVTNLFEKATNNARAIYTGKKIGRQDKIDLNESVEAVKGSGHWLWNSEEAPVFVTEEGNRRKYPIHMNESADLESHKIWGGESLDSARSQYVNALLIRTLAKRHGIEPAIYVPKKIIKFEELPIVEDGKIKIVGMEEYCAGSPKLINSDRYLRLRIPNREEADKFAQLFYTGTALRLRVPPASFKRELGDRVYTQGLLKGLYTQEEVRDIVLRFEEKTSKTMDLVHRYGGTFSEVHGSSLYCGNVSLGGTICDLDTVSFGAENLSEMQAHDRGILSMTQKNFSNLFN